MPSREGESGSKIHKMINLASDNLRKIDRLTNKTKQKYDLFSKFSLSVIGACEVTKNTHIFINRENNHI